MLATIHALSTTYGAGGSGLPSLVAGSMHSTRLNSDVHLDSRRELAVQPLHVMRFSDKFVSSKAICLIRFYIIIRQTL